MICYAAHTTGARNRAALRAARWGLLGSAAYRWTDREWTCLAAGGPGWALDNGAWSAHRAGRPFNGEAFRRAVAECGPVDFVVCPDIVMDADGTRRMIDLWLPWLERQGHPVLVAVQDGMSPADVPAGVGVFVGGSDAWKESSMGAWAALCATRGAWCHIGRVNSVRRLTMARAVDATSIDGSGPSRFSKHLEVMQRGRSAPCQMEVIWGSS